jgi:hypothetical protein
MTILIRRMSVIVAENSDPANVLLQRCVPILEEKIKCMHQDISAHLNDQVATQTRLNDYITRLITGQATVSLSINLPGLSDGQQQPTQISTTSIPQPSIEYQTEEMTYGPSALISSSNQAALASSSVPLYHMRRRTVSVTDLWREWTEKLCGGYAIADLEDAQHNYRKLCQARLYRPYRLLESLQQYG